MKKFGLLLGVLFAAIASSSAQVTVEVTLMQDQFLPGESLPVEVRITNRSGQTLHLGSDPGWLTFSVQSSQGHPVVEQGQVPVLGAFTLSSSMRAIKRVNVAPYFNLLKPGHYSIVANVAIPHWSEQISSKPKSFDIVEAARLWEQEVGVPNPPGITNQAPQVRIYTLQQANYLRRNLMLYLRVTDNSGKIYKEIPIGPMLSFGQPEPQVDRLSNLHVLYQNGPHSFSYTVYDPNGHLIRRQTYTYTTRPRLVADGDGDVSVVGGTRRVMADDVPPPKVADSNGKTTAP